MNPFRQINLLALQELTAKQKTIDKNKNNKIDGEDLAHLRKEELKGAQHKIDKNKNGKVDAHDFKLLRKEESDKPLGKGGKVETKKYSFGTMKTIHHGADFSIPLHPEHHQAIAKLKDQQEHKFKTEDGKHWTAKKSGDNIHFQGANGGGTTHVPAHTMSESHAPVAPTLDKKYIKGTPENKAAKAASKPINGMPTGKMKEETLLDRIARIAEEKPGLYANINAKRKRIEAGSKERMRKPGSKGAPSASDFKDAAKTANENYDDNRRGFGKPPREDDEYHVPDPTVKKNKVSKMKKEEVELQEANHREFASQGKMHPDMAKNMSVGSEHDYYEPKTGDKVSGKVMHKSATEVHMKQTHDSYDPKKKGTVHKFAISSKLDEETISEAEGYTLHSKHTEADGSTTIVMKSPSGKMITHKGKGSAQAVKLRYGVQTEETELDENNNNEELHMNSFKSYIQEDMDESMFPGSPEYKAKFGNDPSRGKVGSTKKTSMGTSTVTDTGVKHERDYEKAEKQTSAPVDQEKRGRGRPKGAASGARQKGSAAKSDDRYDSTGYKLHLPNKNR